MLQLQREVAPNPALRVSKVLIEGNIKVQIRWKNIRKLSKFRPVDNDPKGGPHTLEAWSKRAGGDL